MAPAYARIRSLEPGETNDLLAWIAGEAPSGETVALLTQCQDGPAGQASAGVVWLLAHCDDGVTWGRYDEERLLLSCDQYPPRDGQRGWATPVPGAGNLQQLRLFAEAGEVLVWRCDDAGRVLEGRLMTHTAGPDPAEDPLWPLPDRHILLGTEIAPGGEATEQRFTAVIDPAGRVQVLPCALRPDDFGDGRPPLCLRVVHHLERDDDTGCVSIAASRLAGIAAVPAERVAGEEQR